MTEALAVKYTTDNGSEVALSPQIIKSYLVNGNGSITDQEAVMFLRLCQHQRLNPFLKEAYLIKFGNSPATMVTAKDVFTKRALAHPKCKGWEAGIIVLTSDGELQERTGTVVMRKKGEELVGGWATVHRNDWAEPLHHTIAYEEYVRTKASGEVAANWASMPATMVRKVALVQALRESFPDSLQGLYAEDEMPVEPPVVEQARRSTVRVESARIVPSDTEPVQASETAAETIVDAQVTVHDEASSDDGPVDDTPAEVEQTEVVDPLLNLPEAELRKLIWPSWKAADKSQPDLVAYLKKTFGKKSLKDLTVEEMRQAIAFVAPTQQNTLVN